jgi:hypothetical protein
MNNDENKTTKPARGSREWLQARPQILASRIEFKEERLRCAKRDLNEAIAGKIWNRTDYDAIQTDPDQPGTEYVLRLLAQASEIKIRTYTLRKISAQLHDLYAIRDGEMTLEEAQKASQHRLQWNLQMEAERERRGL